MAFAFRPHHFLCALCFRGSGYSPDFVANFSALMDELSSENGDETMINVINHTDSICQPCPHRTGKTCTSQEKITKLDHAHSDALALGAGDVISWGQAKNRIKENISLAKFHSICSGCEWKNLGICEGVLTEFLGKDNS